MTRTTASMLACLLAVTVAGCGDDDDPSPPGRVLLVGDSLLFQAAGEMEGALRGDGWDVTTAAHPGAGLGGGGFTGVDWPTELDEVLGRIDPEIAVVELGTNGCGDACAGVDAAIAAIMEQLADVSTVLWLTVRTDAPRPDDAAAINDALRRAAADHDNLELLPYHEWLDGRPDLLDADGVHLAPAGQLAVAAHVRDAVRARADIDTTSTGAATSSTAG